MAPPKRPWFRFYVEAVHDRKLRRLKPEHRWLFVACLAAARQSCEPGWLLVGAGDPMGWDDLMDVAAMSRRQVEVGTDALQDAGVLAFDADRAAWFIPAWNERQYESDSSAERTSRWRHRDGDVTVNVTPPDTETDTEPPPSPEHFTSICTDGAVEGLLRNLAEREADRMPNLISRSRFVQFKIKELAKEIEASGVDPLLAARRMAGIPVEVVPLGCDECVEGWVEVEEGAMAPCKSCRGAA